MELFFGKTKISEGLAGTGAIWEITLYPWDYEMHQREGSARREGGSKEGWKGEIKLSLQSESISLWKQPLKCLLFLGAPSIRSKILWSFNLSWANENITSLHYSSHSDSVQSSYWEDTLTLFLKCIIKQLYSLSFRNFCFHRKLRAGSFHVLTIPGEPFGEWTAHKGKHSLETDKLCYLIIDINHAWTSPLFDAITWCNKSVIWLSTLELGFCCFQF